MTQAERFGIIERLLLARGSVACADLQDRLGDLGRISDFRHPPRHYMRAINIDPTVR